MIDRIEKQGRCLCKATGLTIELERRTVSACHCVQCRTWGGGPLMVVETETPLQLNGEENIQVYESSEWAERGFCKQCGSHLFYRLKRGGMYAVPVGLLDDDAWSFELQIFTEQKPDFYCFANQTRLMTGEEVASQHDSE